MNIKAKPKLPKLKVKPPALSSGPGKTLEQVEIQSAVELYLRESGISRFSFNKNKALYQRPWFLIIGPEGSGKSSLFTHAGIEFPVVYPTPEEGLNPEESTQPSIVWWFGQEAVWLDLPGRLFTEENSSLFKDVTSSLQQVRPRSPVNGILNVVCCNDIVEADTEQVRELAVTQRNIIGKLMHHWGVELPVYLIFSKTDEVTGFTELFSDPEGRWDERILGASVEDLDAQRLPRISFLDHFQKISTSLNDIRLRMLARESDEQRRSSMCRFPIDFAGMREKAALYITTLFKQSTYRERPLFGGFFFVCCKEIPVNHAVAESAGMAHESAMLHHPLNPHRKSKRPAAASSLVKKHRRSLFLRPLLSTILPGCSSEVRSTSNRFRKDLISLVVRSGVGVLIILIASIFLHSSYTRLRQEEKYTVSLLNASLSHSEEGLQKFIRIDSVHSVYRRYLTQRRPFYMRVTGYNLARAFNAIHRIYRKKSRDYLIEPCLTILEERLLSSLQYSDVNFTLLKNDLRAYCILSDQRLRYPGITKEDSSAVETLYSIVTRRLIRDAARPRFDTLIRNVLTHTIALLSEGSAGELPDADTMLVSKAQQRLVTLMDNREIYAIILSQERERCNELSVKGIVPDAPHVSLLQTTQTLNEVYTPYYWHKRVLPRFKSVNDEQRYIEKWVTGAHLYRSLPSGEFRHRQINELIGFYLEDVTQQWREYLSSVSTKPFSSSSEAEKSFRSLCARKSPLNELVQQFAEWSTGFTAEDSTLPPPEDLYKKFMKINSFYGEFSNEYYPDYRQHLESVAEGLSKARAERSVALTFNGSSDDPLVAAYDFMEATVVPLLETDAGACCNHLLTSSLASVRSVLSDPLLRELNTLWTSRIYRTFKSDFTSKYPFTDTKTDASFEATSTFFHPTQGALWILVNQYLQHRITERGDRWIVLEKPGLVPLSFSPRLSNSLYHAKSITSVLYGSDGAPHQWTITITAGNHRLRNARFSIEGTEYEFSPGDIVILTWPQKGKIVTGSITGTGPNNNPVFFSFAGPWSAMRLMNDVCIYSGSDYYSSSFNVAWRKEAHATSFVLPAKVNVSGNGHPLCRNVFRGFALPEKLVAEKKE